MKFKNKKIQAIIDHHGIKVEKRRLRKSSGGMFNSGTNKIYINNVRNSFALEYVILHELIHWTAGRNRINRGYFLAKNEYSAKWRDIEENIANYGALFLATELGLVNAVYKDHKEYIKTFPISLDDQVRASKRAAKAVAYLLKGVKL